MCIRWCCCAGWLCASAAALQPHTVAILHLWQWTVGVALLILVSPCLGLPWVGAVSAQPFSAAMQIIGFPDCLLGLVRLYTLYRSSIATLRQQGLHRQSRIDRWKLQVQGV